MAKTFPTSARVGAVTLNIDAHSRKGASRGGHYSFERGPGAKWAGSLEILPNTTAKALEFRAFLHSLRGRAGSFFLTLPGLITKPYSETFSFSDNTNYSDGSKYIDATGIALDPIHGTTTALAVKDANTITASAGFTSSPLCVVGGYLTIGKVRGVHQLLRIVAITGNVVEVRPRLRSAFASGSKIAAGRVTAEFRLAGNTPAVPLIGTTSRGFALDIEETY